MDILGLETEDEANLFHESMALKVDLLDVSVQVGGITANGGNVTDWFWVSSGTKISYPLKWNEGEPNNYENDEYCLSLAKDCENNFRYNDIDCWASPMQFVCQRESILPL